jgi:hypothetical protein
MALSVSTFGQVQYVPASGLANAGPRSDTSLWDYTKNITGGEFCGGLQLLCGVGDPHSKTYQTGYGRWSSLAGQIILAVAGPGGGKKRVAEEVAERTGLAGALRRLLGLGGAANKPRSAYEEAAQGGRHAGFLRNYQGRSRIELERGIRSLERRIAEHESKIRDPERYVPGWAQLDPRQRQALVGSKWPSEIEGWQEQRDILLHLQAGR